MPKLNRLFLILLIGSSSLAGCVGIGGLIGGKPDTHAQEYTGTLKTWNPQIKKISKEVCKSLDGRINTTMASGSDVFHCETGTDSSNPLSMNMLIGSGKFNTTAITARFDESHKKINFRVITSANYGVNAEKENEQKMNEFKTKLQEALKQEVSLEKIE